MLLSLILALGIVWMSARTKVIPFVVEVDKLGYTITIPTALTASNVPAAGHWIPHKPSARSTSCSRKPNSRSVCASRGASAPMSLSSSRIMTARYRDRAHA